MKIIVNEDENLQETEIIINCKVLDSTILKFLEVLREKQNVIIGIKEEKSYVIKDRDILYFESVDKKTFIYTHNEVYESTLKLYEVEKKFSNSHFFRSSKSTVINLSKIEVIKPILGGRLEVLLSNKERLIVSRQYVPILKEKLDY